MKQIRIMAVIPGNGRGATFIFARQQIESLKQKGLEVLVQFFDCRVSLAGIVRNVLRIRSAARQYRPDVIHVQYGTVTAFATALSTNTPLVITFHGSDLQPEPIVGKLRAYVGILLSQLAILRASRVICVTRGLERRLWWRKNTAEILPVGVNLGRFKPEPRSMARERLNWDGHESVVLFNAGTAPATKGLDLAEAAISELIARRGQVHFEVMKGDVPPDKVPLLMNAADCLLVTSRSEGSPGIVKEAMACNLPVVSVDVGDVAERLEGVSPSCIVARDPVKLAQALDDVLSLKGRSNGRERVAELSETRVAEKLKSIYFSVLPGRDVSEADRSPHSGADQMAQD